MTCVHEKKALEYNSEIRKSGKPKSCLGERRGGNGMRKLFAWCGGVCVCVCCSPQNLLKSDCCLLEVEDARPGSEVGGGGWRGERPRETRQG